MSSVWRPTTARASRPGSTGLLSCLFQGAAETTFYVVALYFGSVNVKDSRYTLGIMLIADLVCVITAVFVVQFYF